MKSILREGLLIFSIGVLASCSWFDKKEDAPESRPLIQFKPLPYRVKFEGPLSPSLKDRLKEASFLVYLKDRPPNSLYALERRVEDDVKNLKKVLESKGHFDGEVSYKLHKEKQPYLVEIFVTPHQRYKLQDIQFKTPQGFMTGEERKELLKRLAFAIGDPVNVAKIQAASQEIKRYWEDKGHPFAQVKEPKAIIDRKTKTLEVIYTIHPEQPVWMGESIIEGLTKLDPNFIQNRTLWKEGDLYNQEEVDKTRDKLMKTGLFSSVLIHPQEEAESPEKGEEAAQPRHPLRIEALEAPPRTLGYGVRYGTSEGIGAQVFWRHINVGGKGQSFDSSLRVSKRYSSLKFGYTIPDVGQREQRLIYTLEGIQEKTRAYDSENIEGFMGVERPLNREDTAQGSLGLTLDVGRVDRENKRFQADMFGFPFMVQSDQTDNPLDATKGYKVQLRFVPFWGNIGHEKSLQRVNAKLSTYFALDEEKRFVLASWGRIGRAFIKNLQNLPPNKRFYSGGSASVRAYAYQTLGPLDANQIPLGGRGVLEFGVESRVRVWKNISVVGFLEAAQVSSQSNLIKHGRFFYGPGIGVRYHIKGFFPVRVDIATPLKRRKRPDGRQFDPSYQLIISIGQAF